MATQTFPPLSPRVILAVGAHPDDIDFGASGSIAKWAREGAEVHYLVITDGSKGSSDGEMTTEKLIQTRQHEQREAAKTLGAHAVHFFDYEDAHLEVTMDLKKKITELIRRVKPDTVVVMDPTMVYIADQGFINHSDHRAAGLATLDAVYPMARDHLTFPDLMAKGLPPHKVQHLLLMNLEKHNYLVDISDTLATKLEALAKHESQLPDPEGMRDMLTARAEKLGGLAGCRYAEAFVRVDCPA